MGVGDGGKVTGVSIFGEGEIKLKRNIAPATIFSIKRDTNKGKLLSQENRTNQFSGLVYVSTQQVLRLSANDPQIQIAQDVVNSLNGGADPRQLSPNQLDIKTSFSPFVIIYDKNGKVVASSGQLNKKTLVPPKGVFESAKKYGENKFSWAPAKDVRQAAVIVKYDKGFVLVARSLKETEKRTAVILRFAAIAWLLGIGATTVAFLLMNSGLMGLRSLAPVRKSSSRSSRKTN